MPGTTSWILRRAWHGRWTACWRPRAWMRACAHSSPTCCSSRAPKIPAWMPVLQKMPRSIRDSRLKWLSTRRQTLRTLVDLLVTHDGDYRDVFTTRGTFLTPDLAAVYGVPLPRNAPNGEPSGWQPYLYPEGDPRAGILSEISFVALHAHPGQSSATLRGRALREVILCQKVPDPPPNVSFKLVLDTTNPKYPPLVRASPSTGPTRCVRVVTSSWIPWAYPWRTSIRMGISAHARTGFSSIPAASWMG